MLSFCSVDTDNFFQNRDSEAIEHPKHGIFFVVLNYDPKPQTQWIGDLTICNSVAQYLQMDTGKSTSMVPVNHLSLSHSPSRHPVILAQNTKPDILPHLIMPILPHDGHNLQSIIHTLIEILCTAWDMQVVVGIHDITIVVKGEYHCLHRGKVIKYLVNHHNSQG